eukprot:699964-Rhodomonas_salina.1
MPTDRADSEQQMLHLSFCLQMPLEPQRWPSSWTRPETAEVRLSGAVHSQCNDGLIFLKRILNTLEVAEVCLNLELKVRSPGSFLLGPLGEVNQLFLLAQILLLLYQGGNLEPRGPGPPWELRDYHRMVQRTFRKPVVGRLERLP